MKIVMVINKELPLGLVANTAAVLGISLSKMFQQDIVGCDIQDVNGNVHRGITAQTIPVLNGSRQQIKDIRDLMFGSAYSEITVIDFSEVAQKCLEYEDYSRTLSSLPSSDIYYLGICLYGPKKIVNKLTGNLGLLR
ncbi:DUF2000 domain-containing protein [Sporomusa malonica]|uniref:DUF2000 domain-containing protein n=1 Tax=Sporomusa malonica TaxID=112901 RepID=A0A1W2CXM8_9FIRM|nr:DUF2000 domain-containing protein [Sporomusa malonica]SMC90019.1 hypothetical protein SAMN04488500_11291 [Sporomusa malonica]